MPTYVNDDDIVHWKNATQVKLQYLNRNMLKSADIHSLIGKMVNELEEK